MRTPRTPILDSRDAEAFVQELRLRIPGFLPAWRPPDADPGLGLAHAFARLMESLATRINAAPEKNRLAFYDLLGASLLPASPARAPLAFEAIREVASSVVPAGTQVGGDAGDGGDPVVFETESRIALVAPRLAEVASLWPARDTYALHTERAERHEPFTLHEPQVATPHVLYIAHDELLSLVGRSIVELTVQLDQPAGTDLGLTWEYWDGQVWRNFKPMRQPGSAGPRDSLDGTGGLRRSGVIRLVTDCAQSERRRVDSAEGYWIRARATSPLPPPIRSDLPLVRDIRIQSLIDRPLPDVACDALRDEDGLVADQAYADGQRLDLTKAVEPMGGRPSLGSAFYLSAPEVFGRPGAQVKLCFSKVVTPEEKADEEGAKFEVDVAAVAAKIVDAARDASDTIVQLVQAAQDLAETNPFDLPDLMADIQDARDALATEGMWGIEALDEAVRKVRERFQQLPPNGWLVGVTLPPGLPWNLIGAVPDDDDDILDSILGFSDHNKARMLAAFADLSDAAGQARRVLDHLEELTPYGAALASGATLPSVADPVLAWEFFDGRRWRGLEVEGSPSALNLTGSGPVEFAVPDAMAPGEVNGVEGLWIRARLVAGGYGIVRLVAWKDENTGTTNFFPIVEYRPPVLEKVRLGYTYRSPLLRPSHCLSYNDFRFEDRSNELVTTGTTFLPFESVADDTPALYLGFDGSLPPDVVGLYFDLEESESGPPGPRLVWEGWDGSSWRQLDAKDETRGFSVPGMVFVTWPGFVEPAAARIVSTTERAVELSDVAAGALFRADDRVWLSKGEKGEMARVRAVLEGMVELSQPPAKSYAGGEVRVVTQPRFGRPRTWIRARMLADEPPLRATVGQLRANAVWGVQVETHESEALGSSNGEPDQTFFLRHTPVVGELELEVRELTGARAEIEGPILRKELEVEGRADDYREERDPRTGRVRDVWVRWRERPSLLFAEPEARVCAVERSRGRIMFGGRVGGKIPPPGTDNIVVRSYRAGGGDRGNVAKGAVAQLLSGVIARGATNAAIASGGAPGETPARFLARGPNLVRHRRQAVSRKDYEDLAREATPAVAVARALPATRPDGRASPGWVTVQIVPRSSERRPHPRYALREEVRRFLEARSPAAVRERIAVVPARYLAVGVLARLEATRPEAARRVTEEARGRIEAFLHPLTGGPEGAGWTFGRDVHQSDIAGLLGDVDQLAGIRSLQLTVDASPVPSPISVPSDRIVVAGTVHVELAGSLRVGP